jgi:hypothetical protein
LARREFVGLGIIASAKRHNMRENVRASLGERHPQLAASRHAIERACAANDLAGLLTAAETLFGYEASLNMVFCKCGRHTPPESFATRHVLGEFLHGCIAEFVDVPWVLAAAVAWIQLAKQQWAARDDGHVRLAFICVKRFLGNPPFARRVFGHPTPRTNALAETALIYVIMHFAGTRICCAAPQECAQDVVVPHEGKRHDRVHHFAPRVSTRNRNHAGVDGPIHHQFGSVHQGTGAGQGIQTVHGHKLAQAQVQVHCKGVAGAHAVPQHSLAQVMLQEQGRTSHHGTPKQSG